MKKTILAILVLLSVSCTKSSNGTNEEPRGCVYGKNKLTGTRDFIKCTHREMYTANFNQAALDAIANKYGWPHESGLVMKNYTDMEFIPNNDCNCP